MDMIPVFGLDRQYSAIKPEIDAALSGVAAKGNFVLGENVAAFEREFASYIGVSSGVGVASGTDALTLGLQALGVGAGDDVVIPANSYPTVFGVARAGARIRLAECGDDACIDVSKLHAAITAKTKAVVVVHMYGNPADVEGVYGALHALKRDDIFVVEDCAQAHGAMLGLGSSVLDRGSSVLDRRSLVLDRTSSENSELQRPKTKDLRSIKVGSRGVIGCFSFYPSKNLGAYGDGGMVMTNDPAIAEKVRRLRMYGEDSRYHSLEIAGVSRLDELQAAVLRVKLKHLDVWNARRREIAALYDKGLKGIPGIQPVPTNEGSVRHLYVITSTVRESLAQALKNAGIGTAVHYPLTVHETPSCSGWGYKAGDFPVAERLSRTVLSLPMYPELTDTEIHRIVESVRSAA